MRAVGTTAAGTGTAVVIMAIQATDSAAGSQRRDQTGYIGIFSDAGNRMIGRVGSIKFQPYIGLFDLSCGACRRLVGAVTVAAVAEFFRAADAADFAAALIDATHTVERVTAVSGVRVVAVDAFDMSAIDHDGFRRVVDIAGVCDRVVGKFIEFRIDIKTGNITVVTGDAVIFFDGIIKDALRAAGIVWLVAVFTGITGNIVHIRIWPGVRVTAVPCAGGTAMRGLVPEIFDVAGLAQGGCSVLHDQKFTVAVIVRIMAAGALHLTGLVDFYRPGQGIGVYQFASLRCQPRCVIE